MLVGSCVPTTAPIRIVRVICTRPGCAHVITAMSEPEAIAALRQHIVWSDTLLGPHAE